MRTRNHIYAATCMLLAVFSFAVGDAITKHLTASLSTFAVLSIRALVGTVIICLIGYYKGVMFSKDLFGNSLSILKSIVFVVCISLFAISFKYNSFIQFYTVFFVFLPVASIALQLYFFRKKTPAIVMAPLSLMIISVIYPYRNSLDEVLELSSLYAAATAAFYALFLAISQYVNTKNDSDVISQNIPLFFFAFILLGSLSIFDNNYRDDLYSLFSSTSSMSLVFLASIFSIAGLLFVTRATYFDDASRVAPYEYVAVVYAYFIDKFVFSSEVSNDRVYAAIGVIIGAIILSKVQEK